MAVSGIWAPRADSARAENDVVGTFRSGEVRRRQPVALTEWRVTTDSPDVAETIEQLLGGATSENDSDKESLQVHTTTSSVDVEIESIDSGFVVFSNGAFVRSCNGSVQLGGDEAGQPCPCDGLDVEQRKAFAAKGGCKPDIKVVFRLTEAPNLGRFQFRSGAWTLLESVQAVETKVDEAREDGKTVPGRIAIEQVTSKAGKQFTLPRVQVRRG